MRPMDFTRDEISDTCAARWRAAGARRPAIVCGGDLVG